MLKLLHTFTLYVQSKIFIIKEKHTIFQLKNNIIRQFINILYACYNINNIPKK